MMFSNFLRFSFLISLLLIQSCAVPILRLGPGETAVIRQGVQPRAVQMIEMTAASVTGDSAEISITSDGGVILPPIYFEKTAAITIGTKKPFASRLWGPTWPVSDLSSFTIANYGPGVLSLEKFKVVGGGRDNLYKQTNKYLEAVGTSDWNAIWGEMISTDLGEIGDPKAEAQIPSLREWNIQRHRREAFKRVSGLPLAMRLDSPLIEDVEVRAAVLPSGAAIVAMSRPDPTIWRPLGPGWFPKMSEAKWVHVSKTRRMPRGFEVKGTHLALALYLGGYAPPSSDQHGSVLTDATVKANLFKIDSTAPVRVSQLEGLQTEGHWMELKFDELQPPGQYVIELQAVKGYPAWLAWDQESKPVPGLEWTSVIETLLVHEAPADARYDQPIPVKTWVSGISDQVDHFTGGSLNPAPYKTTAANGEFALEAHLFPGQTEFFYLRDYKF